MRKVTPRRRPAQAPQRGLALLVILVATGVLATVMVGSMLLGAVPGQNREAVTRAALARAKEALIAHAAARMEQGGSGSWFVPGLLPCPAVSPAVALNPEGAAEPSCGAADVTVVGHLPWRSLGIPTPRDGHGECLWYAVSGRFKANAGGSEIFNWDTRAGQIRVLNADGSLAAENVAAVVIAPGPPLDQTRNVANGAVLCPGSYVATDYLEAAHDASNHTMVPNSVPTEPATSIVIHGGIDPASGREVVNDRLIIVTADEIWAAVLARGNFAARFTPTSPGVNPSGLHALTHAVATCLANYARSVDGTDKRLPWAGGREQSANPLTLSTNPDIISVNGLLAGRAPSRHDTWTSGFGEATGNYFTPNAASASPVDCPLNAVNGPLRTWWVHWRDHLYYAVSPDFSPNAPKALLNCADHTPNRCLRVNGGTARYAAIVIFAGRRLSGQIRPQWPSTPPPLQVRQTYLNYLEDASGVGLNNLSNISDAPMWATPPDPTGTGYSYRSDATATSTRDDFAYCIEVLTSSPTPTVTPCPP